ncbi:hypothetical protein H0H93_014128 [Arthromyces matolae]|nr:hypothetical protein H0H93_014128 [Arthromyces matolae]
MAFAELWLTYQLASRAHLKNSATTQLIDLEFQNQKLIDLEDVLEHVFRQGFVEPKYRPATWWEKGDGLKLKAGHLVEELLQQGVGRTPETSLKLVIQDMPTSLWFTYVYRHNSTAPHVAQRIKLAAATAAQGRLDLLAHITNYVFQEGYLPGKYSHKFEPLLCSSFLSTLTIEELAAWLRTLTNTMPRRKQFYSVISPPTLSMSELVKTTLDHDETDLLIDQWLDHRGHGETAYHEWFLDIRERRHAAQSQKKQILAWNKGDFAPENVFCRTVDTGRLIPLDRTWTTHVYHHQSFKDRGLPMKPVVFTMVNTFIDYPAFHLMMFYKWAVT